MVGWAKAQTDPAYNFALPAPGQDAGAAPDLTQAPQTGLVPIAASQTVAEAGSPAQPAAVADAVATPAPAGEAQPIPTSPPAAQPGATPQAASLPGAGGEDPGVKQASCSTCGGGLLGTPGPGPGVGGCGCGSGCCGGDCVPGRLHCCSACDADGCIGRMLCGLYCCVCCPDPCYEPHWVAAANAAFFTDAARPVTQTMIRYDGYFNLQRLDRAEFLFARFNTTPNQDVLSPCAQPNAPGRGLNFVPDRADMHVLDFYTEVARGRFSFFIDLPYRRGEYHLSAVGAELGEKACDKSGLGDLFLGTKSLLLDCELLQLTFEFKTYLPTATASQGLGTKHTALEPSLLLALKLTPDCYLQAQAAYWFSLGGDPNFQGSVWHNHASLNYVLWHILPDVQLIGTAEVSDWAFLDGAFTNTHRLDDAGNPFAVRADSTIWSAGPGLRLNVCDKIDFGVALNYWFSAERIANEEVRAEIRWRF
jgi:hypothetical protein